MTAAELAALGVPLDEAKTSFELLLKKDGGQAPVAVTGTAGGIEAALAKSASTREPRLSAVTAAADVDSNNTSR